MDSGYVKLWRKALDSDLYAFEDLRLPGLFHWLLLHANWRTGKWRGEDVPPGGLVTSVARMASVLGETPKVIRGLLGKLESFGMIETENRANRGTVITVINWQRYQSSESETGQTKGKPDTQNRANQGQTTTAPARDTYDASSELTGQTKGKPDTQNRANQGQTPNTEEGKKNSSPPIIPPKGVVGEVLDSPSPSPEARRLGAMFDAAHEAIRGRVLAPTVQPYADLLCQQALSTGVSPELIETALTWLPSAHGQQGVPRIKDPRQLKPEWFESVGDAKARMAGQQSFRQADESKDYGI